MNKFNFIIDESSKVQENKIEEESIFYEFNRDFKFSFSSIEVDFREGKIKKNQDSELSNFLTRNTNLFSTRIVKTDIEKNVLVQIKQMFDIIKESDKELSYLKMNFKTKLKFRMYWSYEIDRIPKNKIDYNKISGNLLGVPIVLDDDIKTDIVLPITVKNRKNNKFLNIIKN